MHSPLLESAQNRPQSCPETPQKTTDWESELHRPSQRSQVRTSKFRIPHIARFPARRMKTCHSNTFHRRSLPRNSPRNNGPCNDTCCTANINLRGRNRRTGNHSKTGHCRSSLDTHSRSSLYRINSARRANMFPVRNRRNCHWRESNRRS